MRWRCGVRDQIRYACASEVGGVVGQGATTVSPHIPSSSLPLRAVVGFLLFAKERRYMPALCLVAVTNSSGG